MSEQLEVSHISEINLQDIPVMFVVAEGGPAGASSAFDKLEQALPSLKGRRFYGTFLNGEYHACVALREADNPNAYVFEKGTIPEGRYARKKIKQVDERTLGDVLPKEFDDLAERYKGKVDSTRPNIEFYRSEKELFIMLPIL